MGEGCELLAPQAARARFPELQPERLVAALWSPHDLRVESRTALPSLIAWLERQGVAFRFSTTATAIAPGNVETARGAARAGAIVVCPGDDLSTLYPDLICTQRVTRCILQMLRLEAPGFRLPAAVMSDLSLVRYRGYAELAESAALQARLAAEQGEYLEHGVHLIAVQSADGSLVIGDSHHYAHSPEPFAASGVERLILQETQATLGTAPPVLERWTGSYASAGEDLFRAAPEPGVRLVIVTSGTGASTAFAISEETLSDLFGPARERELP
jgi:FAD dependent oxidoreductase TIGR03364